MIRSLKEPRPDGWTVGCDGGASSCGIAGTSILGGGGGAGGGGLNCEAPGSSVCAGAAFGAISANVNAQIKIDGCFMKGMS